MISRGDILGIRCERNRRKETVDTAIGCHSLIKDSYPSVYSEKCSRRKAGDHVRARRTNVRRSGHSRYTVPANLFKVAHKFRHGEQRANRQPTVMTVVVVVVVIVVVPSVHYVCQVSIDSHT